MTESNATQVILTDDGIKIIKAQDTADNATGGVTNLNDPNLMNVIEKQTQASQYAGLTSQYNVVLARAKEANVSTTALTTAYTNLNTFMGSVLADTTVASDVDRDTYKRLTDAYNTALSNVQTALNNSFNTDISNMQSSVSVASQVASSAVIVASQAATTGDNASHVASQAYSAATVAQSAGNNATSVANNASQAASGAVIAGSQATSVANQAFSQAQSAVDYANSEIAIQSTAIGKAQSVADNAFSQAQSVGSQASAGISSNSTATAKAQSTADNAFSQATTAIDTGKVTSQSVTDLKDGSKLTIADLENGLATKVANSEYASYKTQTASQIASKVDNGDFSTYKTQTADLISSKVATKDFNTYTSQTATAIDSKVATNDFNTYKTQTDKLISSKVSSIDFNNLTISNRNLALGTATAFKMTGQNKVNQSQNAYQFSRVIPKGTLVTVTFDIASSTGVGTYTMQFSGQDTGSSWQDTSNGNLVKGTKHISATLTTDSNHLNLWQRLDNATGDITVSNLIVSESSKEVDWTPAPEDQATQSQITQLSGDINLRVTKGDLIDQINIQAGNTIISSSGQLTLSGKSVFLDSVDPVIMKSANIADLAVGTAQIGDGAITNAKIGKLAVGTAQIANAAITDAKIDNISANHLTAGTIDFNTITGKNINASNITTGTLSTDRLNVGQLSALSADLGDVTTGSLKGVDIVANTFSTPNGSFTTDANGSVVASNLTIRGVTNLVYNAALLGGNGSNIPGWDLGDSYYYSDAESFDGVPAIGWNGDSTGRWVATNSKLHPVTQTGIPYSASIKFRDYGSASGMQYTATLAFFDNNRNRTSWVAHWYTASGSDSGVQTFTIDNVIAPSNAKYVNIQLKVHNGKGHVAFSSPMLTQTAQSTGYQPDTGNIINAGIINGSTINGSTINGGTLNMQTDGLINSPYNGIEQSADNFYHPWKLNTGQLTIGQGYITSVSSGTRSINGIPKQFNHVQGTLSASYLKFTNDYGARTYIDADMFTYSNQTNDTAMVTISAGGVGINMGTMSAPALTISNGYIDASSSSSYGVFGSITLGYSPHTINSDSSLFFESGHGSGNPGINIWAKGFHSLSSRLSTKRQVRLLDDEHSNSLLLGADTATFQYNQDTNADNSNEGVIIDDVNTAKQYSLPDELMTRDGKAPTDLMSFIARVISQNKYQARLIEDLQIRLRKVEINNG